MPGNPRWPPPTTSQGACCSLQTWGAGVRLENNRKMQPFPLMQPPMLQTQTGFPYPPATTQRPSWLDPGNIIKFSIQSSWAALTRPQRVRRLHDLPRASQWLPRAIQLWCLWLSMTPQPFWVPAGGTFCGARNLSWGHPSRRDPQTPILPQTCTGLLPEWPRSRSASAGYAAAQRGDRAGTQSHQVNPDTMEPHAS